MNPAMIAFLQHHQTRSASGVVYNALKNCHVKGLTSIVLHDEDGNRVRMFFAEYYHELWWNKHHNSGVHRSLSLAIHPHHSRMRFVGLFGNVDNDVYALTPTSTGAFQQMRYRSGILNEGAGVLEPTGIRAKVSLIRSERMDTNPWLESYELHTVYAPAQERGAWLVLEGEADQQYESICWTNNDDCSFEGLYQPMTQNEVFDTLECTINSMKKGA